MYILYYRILTTMPVYIYVELFLSKKVFQNAL